MVTPSGLAWLVVKAGVGLEGNADVRDTARCQWSAGCRQAASAAGSLRHRGVDAPLGIHLGDGAADGGPISFEDLSPCDSALGRERVRSDRALMTPGFGYYGCPS